MFMVIIWVYCDVPLKVGHPKFLKLSILGTLFLNPCNEPAWYFSFTVHSRLVKNVFKLAREIANFGHPVSKSFAKTLPDIFSFTVHSRLVKNLFKLAREIANFGHPVSKSG